MTTSTTIARAWPAKTERAEGAAGVFAFALQVTACLDWHDTDESHVSVECGKVQWVR